MTTEAAADLVIVNRPVDPVGPAVERETVPEKVAPELLLMPMALRACDAPILSLTAIEPSGADRVMVSE